MNYIIGVMYNHDKCKVGGKRDDGCQNDNLPTRTTERIAKELGIGVHTVHRAGKFASAVDKLSQSDPELKKKILSGKSGVTQKGIVEIAAMGEGLFMFCGADGTYPGQPETAPYHPDGL